MTKDTTGKYSHKIFEPKGVFDNYGMNIWKNLSYFDTPNGLYIKQYRV